MSQSRQSALEVTVVMAEVPTIEARRSVVAQSATVAFALVTVMVTKRVTCCPVELVQVSP